MTTLQKEDDAMRTIHMGEEGPRRIITVDPPEPATVPPEQEPVPVIAPEPEQVPA